MNAPRHRPWAWVLITAAALATPATSQAQLFFGGGNLFGSPVSSVPFGGWWGGYANAPYRNPSGFYPYGYSMGAAPQPAYNYVPAYQPLYYSAPAYNPYQGYPGATSYLGTIPGVATAGLGARMRNTPLAGTGGRGFTAAGLLGPGSGIAGRPGDYTTAPLASAGVAPFACASAGCGAASLAALNYAASAVAGNPVALNAIARRGNNAMAAGIRHAGTGPAEDLTNTAAVDISVPTADAELWVEGQRMTLTGMARHFVSPQLTPGSRYAYTIRARWEQNGQTYSQSQNVEVRAGNTVRVAFTTP